MEKRCRSGRKNIWVIFRYYKETKREKRERIIIRIQQPSASDRSDGIDESRCKYREENAQWLRNRTFFNKRGWEITKRQICEKEFMRSRNILYFNQMHNYFTVGDLYQNLHQSVLRLLTLSEITFGEIDRFLQDKQPRWLSLSGSLDEINAFTVLIQLFTVIVLLIFWSISTRTIAPIIVHIGETLLCA